MGEPRSAKATVLFAILDGMSRVWGAPPEKIQTEILASLDSAGTRWAAEEYFRAPLSPEIRAAFGTALEVMANRAREHDEHALPEVADRIRQDAATLRSFLSVSTEGRK